MSQHSVEFVTQGPRFETPMIGVYQVRDGLFARARMYYYELPGVIAFLAQAAALRSRA